MLHRPLLIGTATALLASAAAAQTGAAASATIDPCAVDAKSPACRTAREAKLLDTQKTMEAQRSVSGLAKTYRPAKSGDRTMRDTYAPTATIVTAQIATRLPPTGQPSATGPRRVSPGAASRAPTAGGGVKAAGAGPTFDVDLFAAKIEAALDGKSAGYAYSIAKNGQLAKQGASGKARKATEGNINQSATRRQNIASISKMITAVGVLRLMEELGLDLDDKIAPYLPDAWALGPNVDDLTFRHLFTHSTGFTSANNDFWNTLSWDGLRTMVATGANPGANFNYLNANFALFRFILPAMWKEAGAPYPIYTENGTAAAWWYILYFQENIFGPIGVASAQCLDPSDNTETLFYDAPASLAGVNAGDWNIICGSGGWVLSANDLANFLTHAMHDNAILSPAMRTLMKNERLGVYRYDGENGDYFSHGGAIGFGGGQGMVMCLMTYSISVEAAVLVNSPVAGGNFCNTVLGATFDDSWQ